MAKTPKKSARKRKSSAKPKQTPKDICFVIMPFGGHFDSYYSSIYIPAITDAGLTPIRADDLFRTSMIIKDIWEYTKKAKILLADLSGRNPNVFYELGLAHAIPKPVILVTDSIESVPFDLRHLRVIEYDKNRPNWGDLLKERIQVYIKEVLSSPANAILPPFLEVSDSAERPTVTEVEKEIIQMRQELDLIQRQIQWHPQKRIVISPPSETQILDPAFSMSSPPNKNFQTAWTKLKDELAKQNIGLHSNPITDMQFS